jgi:hypothetical protein
MMRAGPASGFKGRLSPDLIGRDCELGMKLRLAAARWPLEPHESTQ